MVAGKLDPTVGRILFLPYLSNGDESEKKKTAEMSSDGPKMVKRRYGSA